MDGYRAAATALKESLLNEPPAVLPPLPMMKIIGSQTEPHYLANMREYAADLIVQCGLDPNASILDIGTGCGRVASAFQRYLSDEGRYLGFDVWDEGVQWCTEHLSAARRNFQFRTTTAVNNYYYDPDSEGVNDFDLSFIPAASFDCIFALSVFTHLKLRDARQYFRMVANALAPNGHAYLTFFIIDEHVHRFVRETGQHTALAPAGDGMWYGYERQDFFSGYEEPLLLAQLEEAGLEIVNRSPGSWAQKPGARLYQDWLLLRRKARG